MFILIRAAVYATAFVAVLLGFVPAGILERTGIDRPHSAGPLQFLACS